MKCIVGWYWFGLVLRNVCKKENVVFSKKLSKCFQNPCSCFGYRLSYNHPNEVIPMGKELYKLEIQIYRRDYEQIVDQMFPNKGLKVSFW